MLNKVLTAISIIILATIGFMCGWVLRGYKAVEEIKKETKNA